MPFDEIEMIDPDARITVDASGDLCGEWDALRVTQVFASLIGNAVKHGGGDVKVKLVGGADAVIMEVSNDGPPMPEHQLEHLFEPFLEESRRREGLGLGLYIVRKLVRAHGGTMQVRSRAGEGTTFIVSWPRDHGTTKPS